MHHLTIGVMGINMFPYRGGGINMLIHASPDGRVGVLTCFHASPDGRSGGIKHVSPIT